MWGAGAMVDVRSVLKHEDIRSLNLTCTRRWLQYLLPLPPSLVSSERRRWCVSSHNACTWGCSGGSFCE
jgi:hypothetical protein